MMKKKIREPENTAIKSYPKYNMERKKNFKKWTEHLQAVGQLKVTYVYNWSRQIKLTF